MNFKTWQIIAVVTLLFVASCSRKASIEGVYISPPQTDFDGGGGILRIKLDFRSDGTMLFTGFDGTQKWVKYDVKDNMVIVHENSEEMTLQKDGKDLLYRGQGAVIRYVQQ
jgi:hypothetical protein